MLLTFGEGKVAVQPMGVKIGEHKVINQCALIKDHGTGRVGEYLNTHDDGVVPHGSPIENAREGSVKTLNRYIESTEDVVLSFKNVRSVEVLIHALITVRDSIEENE